LTAVVSVKLTYPEFEGCTHGTLGNAEVRGYVRQAVEEYLAVWLAEHPRQAAEILDRIG
jgi:DNA gyrase subunit B